MLAPIVKVGNKRKSSICISLLTDVELVLCGKSIIWRVLKLVENRFSSSKVRKRYLVVTKKQTRFLLIYEEFSKIFLRFPFRKSIIPSL